MMRAHDHRSFERALRDRIRGEVAFDDLTRGLYATDASIYQIHPVAVVTPIDEADARAAIELAGRHGVSITPRGGGTGLAGQAVGASLVLDFSKHMNRVLEVNVDQRWVRVQAGLVRDELNAMLAPHGLHFAPDPATTNRANVGGMIANNSSGMRSIIFGKTIDHVLETRVLLSDGEEMAFAECDPERYRAHASGAGREAEIYRGVRGVIDRNREEIEKRFPKVMRRVSGYNLDAFVSTDRWNISKLIVGSEGTLATLLEAKLNLEPLPACTALALAHFDDLLEAIRSVPQILEHGPSAVEILDRTVVSRAKSSLTTATRSGFFEGAPEAVLIVEFFGETSEAVEAEARRLASRLRDHRGCTACPLILDPAEQKRVWEVRKHGLGLMLKMRGDRKPIPFIEDAAVPVAVLADYIADVLDVCRRHGTDVAMYAHASVGLIHVRPIIDLKRRDGIDTMKAIQEAAFELVRRYGGAWAGEHGDGLVRSPFVERFFGPQLYGAFREIKRLFDPAGFMNPGKIVDAGPVDANLRYGVGYRVHETPTLFHFREDGGFAAAVEMCNGVGACRKTLVGTMCPSYIATRDEIHSTRGRANALRLAMSGQLGSAGLASRELKDVLDLCLSCKACKSECPSNVDVARLKSEVLRIHHERHGASIRERLIAAAPETASRLAGPLAPVANFVLRSGLFRRTVGAALGFDRRRRLPAYARVPFPVWFRTRSRTRPSGSVPRAEAGRRDDRRVVLFDDTYMNYHEPGVGRAAVALLESCGYEVTLARAGCCQRPRLSHGFLREAMRDGERTLRNLDRYAAEGLPILVCEPGCASALVDDLPDLIDDRDLGDRIRASVMMIDQFLARELDAGRLSGTFSSPMSKLVIHGHCHQKSLFDTEAMKRVLSRLSDLEVRDLDAGCCGMAGSFGYEREHYDLSMKVGEDRFFPALRKLDPGTVVVACGFSCRHQIAEATGLRAIHWVETLRGDLGHGRS